jgi:hypothetical protein
MPNRFTSGVARILLAACAGAAFSVSVANADPQGDYIVTGKNPSDGSAYEGTVSVTRTGNTYAVAWEIDGSQYAGVGIGAAPTATGILVGPSSPADNALSIGYVTDGGFGQVFIVEQADGTWKGIWAYGGGDVIGDEVWTRK